MKTLKIKDTWLNVKKNFCNSLQCQISGSEAGSHSLSAPSLSHHAGGGGGGGLLPPNHTLGACQLVKLDEEISKISVAL